MALAKDRARIFVHGLGNLEIRERIPSEGVNFESVGHIQDATFSDLSTVVECIVDTGDLVDVVESERKGSIKSMMMQSSESELNLLINSVGKYYACRYFGIAKKVDNTFQYFCTEQAKIIPSIELPMKVGLHTIPLDIRFLAQTEVDYDIPLIFIIETKNRIYTKGMNLWLSPRNGWNAGTAKILDASGYARHGDISADFASIFIADTAPLYILRHDGSNDVTDLGDVLDLNATNDFSIDFWVRIKGADASLQEILSKKADDTDVAGFRVVRTAGNKIEIKLSDGVDSVSLASTTSVLQNVWKHVQIFGDRTGNMSLYLNGVSDATPTSIAAIGDMSNAIHFLLGKFGSGFGQVDLSTVRFYNYGVDGLPTNIATIAATHYAAEKSYHGL